MTIKQNIVAMLERLPDDADYDRVIEGIYVLQRYEIGLDEIRHGKISDDEDVMAELLSDSEPTSPGV